MQGDHIHLMVEAENRRALARGMQSLSVRIARALNEMMGTSEGHRANILASGSNEIGVGLLDRHWVQVFGSRR